MKLLWQTLYVFVQTNVSMDFYLDLSSKAKRLRTLSLWLFIHYTINMISFLSKRFSLFPASKIKFSSGTFFIITPPRNCIGVIFSLQFVCVCVCVCVRLFLWTKFQPNGWTDLDGVLVNGCLAHWLRPYWNWWPWAKGQGPSGSKFIFSHDSLLTSLWYISALICVINLKFIVPHRYALCRFV